MATYFFNTLGDDSLIGFAPTADVLSFVGTTIGAASLLVDALPDGRGLSFTAGGKTVTLDGLTPWTLRADAFAFTDGSRVLALTAASSSSLVGTSGGDLLVGGATAFAMAVVSVTLAGTPGASPSTTTSYGFSADGRYTLFSSGAADLVAGDTNGQPDFFVRDLRDGVTTRVSLGPDGSKIASDADVSGATISEDGRTIAFNTTYDVAGATAGTVDVLVKDVESGALRLASSSASGTGGNGSSFVNSMSGSGRFVAFQSSADNLGIADTNGLLDVYVKDMRTCSPTPSCARRRASTPRAMARASAGACRRTVASSPSTPRRPT